MPQFDSTTFLSQIFWLIVHFGILYFIMARVALPKLLGVLEIREQRLDADLSQAKKIQQETDYVQAELRRSQIQARAAATDHLKSSEIELSQIAADKRQSLTDNLASMLTESDKVLETAQKNAIDSISAEAEGLVQDICKAVATLDVTKAQTTIAVAKVSS